MKLAEALSIRKDLQKRIQQLGQRIQNNVKVQEGDEPSEKPEELLKEQANCLAKLEDIIWHINATNMQTTNGEGKTLTRLMAEEALVSLNDGSFYGSQGEGYLRVILACFKDDTVCFAALDRMAALFRRLAAEKGL